MSTFKKLIAIAFIAAFGLLAGCDSETDKIAAANAAAKIQKEAREAGAAEEARKAEQRWIVAREVLRNIGKTTAKEGGYTSAKNCEVLPAALTSSPSYQEFKVLGLETYKGSCAREVGIMAAERKANSDRAVAQAKERERKAAIAKANAEQKRKLATKASPVKTVKVDKPRN